MNKITQSSADYSTEEINEILLHGSVKDRRALAFDLYNIQDWANLKRMMDDKDDEVRGWAAIALYRAGDWGLLEEKRDDTYFYVRAVAAFSFVKTGNYAALNDMSKDPSPFVRSIVSDVNPIKRKLYSLARFISTRLHRTSFWCLDEWSKGFFDELYILGNRTGYGWSDKLCHAFLHFLIVITTVLTFHGHLWLALVISESWGWSWETLDWTRGIGASKFDLVANNVGMILGTVFVLIGGNI